MSIHYVVYLGGVEIARCSTMAEAEEEAAVALEMGHFNVEIKEEEV